MPQPLTEKHPRPKLPGNCLTRGFENDSWEIVPFFVLLSVLVLLLPLEMPGAYT
jgi:hypothetical protein